LAEGIGSSRKKPLFVAIESPQIFSRLKANRHLMKDPSLVTSSLPAVIDQDEGVGVGGDGRPEGLSSATADEYAAWRGAGWFPPFGGPVLFGHGATGAEGLFVLEKGKRRIATRKRLGFWNF
jgi:hypothetical protein